MEKNPLFSIITITYNAEKELTRTLVSVREQTFGDYEHILIDGASSDNTLQIAREEGCAGIRIFSEPDKGLYDAMNKGLRAAAGRYVLFLNAGDSFHSPDTLAAYAQGASENADIIYGDTDLVDGAGKFVAHRHLSAPEKLSFRSFRKGMLVCHQAFAVRREIAPEYDLAYRFSADYDWCLKCLKQVPAEKCCNLRRVTIDYLTDGLTDRNRKKSLKERYRIMCRYYGTVPTVVRHFGFLVRFIWHRFTSGK